jgi:hypothetical protein
VPGPEVLGGDVAADNLAEVGVDVGATDVAPGAELVAEGEQFLARVVAGEQLLDDGADVGVDEGLQPVLAALRGVLEHDDVTIDADVLAAHRGEAERAVVLGVLLAADPEEAEVEQPERAGQHAVAGQAVLGEVLVDLLTRAGQPVGHGENPLVLLGITLLAPRVVVAVLAPPAASVPNAWMCPFGHGQIQTSCQAGGARAP